MSAEECKGYACPPSTTVDLPECEDGWEIGNGTAVCATQQPTSVPLAATGADVPLGLAAGGIALVVVGVYALLLRRHIRRRSERNLARNRAYAEAISRKLDHDLEEARAEVWRRETGQ